MKAPLTKERQIGVFGGSFDPPHVGHIQIVTWLLAEKMVERVFIIPCFIHPFGKTMIPYEHRMAMCQLAFGSFESAVLLSDIEKVLGGISYTIRTLKHLVLAYPQHRFLLVTGADIESEKHTWREYEEIEKRAEIISLPRGEGSWIPDVSATVIREAVKRGTSINHLVSSEVADYIARHKLYQ